jgi:hypothetical protein
MQAFVEEYELARQVALAPVHYRDRRTNGLANVIFISIRQNATPPVSHSIVRPTFSNGKIGAALRFPAPAETSISHASLENRRTRTRVGSVSLFGARDRSRINGAIGSYDNDLIKEKRVGLRYAMKIHKVRGFFSALDKLQSCPRN